MKKVDDFFGNISIDTKIKSIAFLVMALGLVFVSIVTVIGRNSNTRYQKSMDEFFRQFSLMRDITESYNNVHAMSIEFLLFWGDEHVTAQLSRQFDESFAILEEDIIKLEGMLPPESPQNEAINKVYGYLYHLQNFRYALPSLNRSEVEGFFLKLQREIIDPLNKNTTVAFNSMVSNINAESINLQNNYDRNIRGAFIAIFVLFLLGAVYVSIIIRNISVPLKNLSQASEYFGRGDFKSLGIVSRKDELGVLNNKFFSAAQDVMRLNSELEALSTTDEVTGISNRRALDAYAARIWEECKRLRQPLAIVYLDIDRFKYYNDTFGHLKGDECLRSFVNCVQRCIRRSSDMLARAGGEEFVLVLPFCAGKSALELAEMIRRNVEDLRIPNPKSEAGPYLTVSIGLAARHPYQMKGVQELMELADQLCYTSKTTGRNRITSDMESPFDPEAELLSIQNNRMTDSN
ncbi:MAG: diguanylate cyclase [Synergistaceae bacterium]|jgi:diguanylate cyclase (GGDEF)-like protein|nr:diguanylate cyclase [Synergistaceae bacterium]